MDRARIAGQELEYEVRGTGEPVVLVHGVLIADAFAPLLVDRALSARYALIAYHRRGYAGSTHADAALSIGEQAADCRALMRHLGIARAHVVGHSYGGVIALHLAREAPDMVHSLALLEPALLIVPSAEQFMAAMTPVLQNYEAGDRTAAVDGFLRAVVGPEYRDVLDRRVPGAFAQAVADADTFFRIELPALRQWSFTQADAGRVRQPVLTVVGANSHTLWPGWLEVHDLVQAWLPQAQGYVLAGATHGLQLMNPGDLAAALAGFWARHPMPARPGA